MPVKQVHCSICSSLVNKCTTLLVDASGKRACRSHPETLRLTGFLHAEKEKEEGKGTDPMIHSIDNARQRQAYQNMKADNPKWIPYSRPLSASRLT